MKIPLANPARQVQSLGRRDIGAPLQVAGAKARAAQYEGAALREYGRTAGEVADYILEYADQEAVREYNEQMLLAKAESEKIMGILSENRLDPKMPGMSTLDFDRQVMVRSPDGSNEMRDRTTIPTYEVGGQYYSQEMERIQQRAMENIKDRRARDKFVAEWALYSAQGNNKVAAHLRKQRNTELRGGFELQLEQFTDNDDVRGAEALIYQSHASGIIDAKEASDYLSEVQTNADRKTVYHQLADARDDPAATETIITQLMQGYVLGRDGVLRKTVMDPDELEGMLTQVDSQRKRQDRQQDRIQDETYQSAMTEVAAGTMTQAKLIQLGKEEKLSGAQINTLNNALIAARKRAEAGKADADSAVGDAAKADIEWRIANLLNVVGTDQTVLDNYRYTKDLIMRASTPTMGPNGEVRPALLESDDALALSTKLETMYARMDNNPTVATAYRLIGDVSEIPTGAEESALFGSNVKEEDRNAKIQSRSRLRRDLSRALQRDPGLDATQWVEERKDIYAPQAMKAKTMEEFQDAYGQMLAPFYPTAPGTPDPSKAMNDNLRMRMERLNYLKAISNARRAGRIDDDAAAEMVYRISGAEVPPPTEPSDVFPEEAVPPSGDVSRREQADAAQPVGEPARGTKREGLTDFERADQERRQGRGGRMGEQANAFLRRRGGAFAQPPRAAESPMVRG